MEKYGLLTFHKEAGVNKHGKTLWELKCDCGKTTVAVASQVRSGKTKSCGHLKTQGNRRTHGKRSSKVYTAWCNMKARCMNTFHKQYKDYGGRGIMFQDSWKVFESFYLDVGDPPTMKHTLDRIDNSGNYTKDNVRWALRYTQARNSRQNIWVAINGTIKCLYDWCDEYNISAGSVYKRMSKGIDVVTAITKPKKR